MHIPIMHLPGLVVVKLICTAYYGCINSILIFQLLPSMLIYGILYTTYKRYKHNLKDSDRRFQLLADNTEDGVILMKDLEITHVNSVAKQAIFKNSDDCHNTKILNDISTTSNEES